MTAKRGGLANSPIVMRHLNQKAVVQFALGHESFTTSDLIAETGLTRATVIAICTDLIAAGWLADVTNVAPLDHPHRGDSTTPERSRRRGRPGRQYALSPAAGSVIGIDAGQHTITGAIATLRGTTLARREVPIDAAELTDAERVEAVRTLAQQLLDDAQLAHTAQHPPEGLSVPVGRPLLTVIGVPAPVDKQGHSPRGDNDFWDKMNPHYRDELERVRVYNDANLAAVAERFRSGGTNLATVLSGERLGAGLIVDGELLRGKWGGAGEMRFLTDFFGDAEAFDGAARLARRWTSQALAGRLDGFSGLCAADVEGSVLAAGGGTVPGGAGASAMGGAGDVVPGEDGTGSKVTAEQVFAAAGEEDRLACAVLERIGIRLARITSALSSLLGVETVIVAGALASAMEPVIEVARRTLTQITTGPYPELRASDLGRDVVVHGAIEAALAGVRADPLGFQFEKK